MDMNQVILSSLFARLKNVDEVEEDMGELIDRWYSLRLIQDLKDD